MPDFNSIDINLRASGYFIARTTAVCRRCHQPTRLFAVGLPAGHELLELDDDAVDDGAVDDEVPGSVGSRDTWQVAIHSALLFHVAYVSASVRRQVLTMCRTLGIDSTARNAEPCWANRCEHCGVQFDDQELFSEPGDAFVPASEADARHIHLVRVDESIEAQAAGYAYRPEFFDSMSRD